MRCKGHSVTDPLLQDYYVSDEEIERSGFISGDVYVVSIYRPIELKIC
jgi:hypothetical protein